MASKSSSASSRRRTLNVSVAAIILLIAAGAALWFRSGHGELGAKGHNFSVALFSACNLRDSKKIDQLEQLIEDAKQEGSISNDEVKWLMAIVDHTRSDRWDKAARQLRSLMSVQAVPNRALPDLD